MKHYCGIDLHSTKHVVVIIDEEDKRVLEVPGGSKAYIDYSLDPDGLATRIMAWTHSTLLTASKEPKWS